jgi:hypothetical protein
LPQRLLLLAEQNLVGPQPSLVEGTSSEAVVDDEESEKAGRKQPCNQPEERQ